MYNKDYIIRMMEMIADLIAALLGFIKKGDLEKGSHLLNSAYRDLLQQDAAYFHLIPASDLTEVLLREHHFTNDHIKVLSDLFYAEGELQLAKANRPMAQECFEKSLLLLDFVEQDTSTFSLPIQKRRQTLLQKIENFKK